MSGGTGGRANGRAAGGFFVFCCFYFVFDLFLNFWNFEILIGIFEFLNFVFLIWIFDLDF